MQFSEKLWEGEWSRPALGEQSAERSVGGWGRALGSVLTLIMVIACVPVSQDGVFKRPLEMWIMETTRHACISVFSPLWEAICWAD